MREFESEKESFSRPENWIDTSRLKALSDSDMASLKKGDKTLYSYENPSEKYSSQWIGQVSDSSVDTSDGKARSVLVKITKVLSLVDQSGKMNPPVEVGIEKIFPKEEHTANLPRHLNALTENEYQALFSGNQGRFKKIQRMKSS